MYSFNSGLPKYTSCVHQQGWDQKIPGDYWDWTYPVQIAVEERMAKLNDYFFVKEKGLGGGMPITQDRNCQQYIYG